MVNFLKVAKFVHSLLDKGMRCSPMDAISIAFAVMTIGALLIGEIATSIWNPIVGFVVGLGLDAAIEWLFDQTEDCVAA